MLQKLRDEPLQQSYKYVAATMWLLGDKPVAIFVCGSLPVFCLIRMHHVRTGQLLLALFM